MTTSGLMLLILSQAAPHSSSSAKAAQSLPLNAPVEPVQRTAPLSTEQADQLPLRVLADRSFGQVSDVVVAAWRPGGLAAGVALTSVDFMLQPTGGAIGGLCRSTEVTVMFGREKGPGTLPNPPETKSTPRRVDDVWSRRLFKVIEPLHRLKTVTEQYAADAVCARRRDLKSFMVTNLPDEDSLIPALIGIEQALEQRRAIMGSRADVYRLPATFGGDVALFAMSNVAAVRGITDAGRIAQLEVVFAPGGVDSGYGAKLTISDVTWSWPDFQSANYGVPKVTIGKVAIKAHEVSYD